MRFEFRTISSNRISLLSTSFPKNAFGRTDIFRNRRKDPPYMSNDRISDLQPSRHVGLSVCAFFMASIATFPLHAEEAHIPAVVAHRGLLLHAPENTLANFRACLELRLGFEFDVSRTRDGHLVCIHDVTVDRTTDGSGRVADMTLSQLRGLDAGSWFDSRFRDERVPTVDEVMKLIADHPNAKVLVAVDVKVAGAESELVTIARRHGVLDRLVFIGMTITESKVRSNFELASTQARTAVVANDSAEFEKVVNAPDVDWIYFRFIPTESQMTSVRIAGKRTFVAGPTVSGPLHANWRRAIDLGFDAVLTDFPLEFAEMSRHRPAK
jgi:glycerophosphoryl diester phosphodiesterase